MEQSEKESTQRLVPVERSLVSLMTIVQADLTAAKINTDGTLGT